jgi:hypothetical protein
MGKKTWTLLSDSGTSWHDRLRRAVKAKMATDSMRQYHVAAFIGVREGILSEALNGKYVPSVEWSYLNAFVDSYCPKPTAEPEPAPPEPEGVFATLIPDLAKFLDLFKSLREIAKPRRRVGEGCWNCCNWRNENPDQSSRLHDTGFCHGVPPHTWQRGPFPMTRGNDWCPNYQDEEESK